MNYPRSNRDQPFDVLQFLYGATSSRMAKAMYDDGAYVDGRYEPNQRIVIMVYNGYPSEAWPGGGRSNEGAVVVGYFGAIIVGYGQNFHDCDGCTPGDWTCYADCIAGGQNANTVYGLASDSGPLTLDPTLLLQDFLPKQITLVR